jgi:uncharacterized protein (TIGR02246 family)
VRLILILALLAAASSTAFPQTGARKHPVETFFMEGIRAFNAHDLDEFMKQFADDLQMYAVDRGVWLRGKAAVRQRFVETFRQFPSARMEIEDLRVRSVARNVAVVDFKFRTYPLGTGPAFHGVGSGVYVLRRGRWVEVLEHESITSIDEGLRRGGK